MLKTNTFFPDHIRDPHLYSLRKIQIVFSTPKISGQNMTMEQWEQNAYVPQNSLIFNVSSKYSKLWPIFHNYFLFFQIQTYE